ncbi:serine/threonine-protein kinase [Nonomuraea sp. NPDC050783]|uniref:serine/threonine-protein kinase n=1 Tax=Nonomuraea sp. NPDC050783 TaxID=3154634 RepID=UPI003465B292
MVPGYRDVRQLGAGRTGRVFLATYQPTGAHVAIKYLNATLRRDAEFMERFRSDTHHLVELDDPHVVRLHEYVETPTRAAVVMELVDGVSLRTLLAEHGPLPPEAALAALKSVLLALAAAHERGVAHRDVKPDNVLVQADGAGRLADFGVVVHAEEPGVPAGSPAYMAPELWTRHQAGPAADLYAAACTLFEAVRGRAPFQAYKEGEPEVLDVPAVRDRHLVEPVPVEVVPDALRGLLRRGLAKDPAARYASARQFAAELEADAAAGYGPDWEQRGRRRLAELATLLALRFPLARTTPATGGGGAAAALRDRVSRMPRLPPHLWVTGALVVAALVGVALSGGRLPSGPGAILVPPPEGRSGPAPSPADATTAAAPPRGTSTAAPPRATAAAPPRTAAPRNTPPPPPPPQPTGGQAGSGVPRPAVQAATILRWSGRAGSIRVAASGPERVRLRVTYTRRDGDGAPAATLHRETRVLSGRTRYTSTIGHDPGAVACGRRAYLGVLVMTEPPSGNGPQVSEAVVDGPACPAPSPSPTRSTPPPPPPTGPPTGPSARPSTGPAIGPGGTSGDPTGSLAGQPSVR